MNKRIKALIVDDEYGACENLHRYIEQLDHSIEVIGYAQSTKVAEDLINSKKPNLLFLDIEMPTESGINFLKRLASVDFEVVFVTAYDQYALKAFKLNAIDYVLKPLNKQYLKKSLERVKEFITKRNSSHNAHTEIIKNINIESCRNLVLRNGAEVHLLKLKDILYLSADGNYTKIYLENNKKPYIGSYTLRHYEETLPVSFVRVHRRYVVNYEKIKYLKSQKGKHFIELHDNTQITISRRRYKSFKEKLSR